MKIMLLIYIGLNSYIPALQVETHSFTDCSAQGREIVRDAKRQGVADIRFECRARP